jgi:hypothetical protein
MAKGVEHFFMYLLAICIFENCLLNSFALLLTGLLALLVFNFSSSLDILDHNTLSDE